LGQQISVDYSGRELVAVAVLRGSFVFAGDLVRQIDPKISLRMDFIAASSYGDRTNSSGHVEINQQLQVDISGRSVLIIEDIVETGRTLRAIQDTLWAADPDSVRTVTLLYKEGPDNRDLTLDYVGFRIPNVFVVGYGLDFAQMHRHLPDIRLLESAPEDGMKDHTVQ
jgi:hypoxanthine phosphoribosyltransferase